MNADNGLLRKAQKYIASSRLLCDSGDYDSAISRLYYAAFYLAEALLEELGLSFSSHKGVISAFGQEFAKTAKLDPRFHRLLISTFEKRLHAIAFETLTLTNRERRVLRAIACAP